MDFHWSKQAFPAPVPSFINRMTRSRRLFAWAGERRRRSPEPQFASPPVATRNGLAQPTRIGAPRVSETPSAQTDRRSPPPDCVFLTNEEPPEDPGRTIIEARFSRGLDAGEQDRSSQSHLYDQARLKTRLGFGRITPRVGHNMGLAACVIAAVVDVAMHPQPGFALDDETAHVRSEGGT